MTMIIERAPLTSQEAKIDDDLDSLAAKILDGKATATERCYYEQLASERTEMLQPTIVTARQAA